MPPRLVLFTLSLSSLWLVHGCAIGTQRTGKVFDPALVARVKVGTSTKQDVLDLFGPPTRYDRIPGTGDMTLETTDQEWRARFPIETAKAAEDVFTYEYREEPETFFSMLLFTYFSRDVLTDRLMVVFDVRDVVKYIAFVKETDREYEPEEEEEAGE
ncbi:MAG: hypothetical protein D6731_16185 [Planctomycetota bacterium]|nr:MAG: hypothetical protein D6731_16185 [Planctomycetota bacterium]